VLEDTKSQVLLFLYDNLAIFSLFREKNPESGEKMFRTLKHFVPMRSLVTGWFLWRLGGFYGDVVGFQISSDPGETLAADHER